MCVHPQGADVSLSSQGAHPTHLRIMGSPVENGTSKKRNKAITYKINCSDSQKLFKLHQTTMGKNNYIYSACSNRTYTFQNHQLLTLCALRCCKDKEQALLQQPTWIRNPHHPLHTAHCLHPANSLTSPPCAPAPRRLSK